MNVTFDNSLISEEETRLTTLKLSENGNKQTLTITKDALFIIGDIALLKLEDINFDGEYDLALSTTAGTSNFYWRKDSATQQYVKVGNCAQFSLNPKNQTLEQTVKVDAATYITKKHTGRVMI